MRNILLTVSYDGTNFCGWQRQNDQRTVQEEIEKVICLLHKKPISLFGSGRTDSGVHAAGQAANFHSPIDSIPIENYPLALNSHLPHDIRILKAEEKPLDFHARFSATSRTYRYFINCEPNPIATRMPYVWPIHRHPDINRLNQMASCLHGETDCTTFSAAEDKSPSKCRYIEKAVFYVQDGNLVFEIKANAFLWKMVRSLVGSLIEYEKKGFTADDFNRILLSKDRSLAGVTAPPTGLFLWSVGFDGKRMH